jgi:hypothetical protein
MKVLGTSMMYSGRKVEGYASHLVWPRISTHRNVCVFATLTHISCVYSHNILGYTDYVTEVDPRHAAFYKRMRGLPELAKERMCTRVGARAVLLRLECRFMTERFEPFGGSFENYDGKRTFYPNFRSTDDEPEKPIG